MTTSLDAQKFWLSGYHSYASVDYLSDGVYKNVDVVWEGGTPKNETNVVIYGQFIKDKRTGKPYFSVEKSAESVQLFSGNFRLKNFDCPVNQIEGILTKNDGTNINIVSFTPIQDQENATVTKAEWGVKNCNNKTHSVYYIQETQNTKSSQSIAQRVLDPEFNVISETREKTEIINGKIISTEKEFGLEVPNLAQFQTEDGTTQYISNTERAFSVGEKLSLQGYSNTTYYEGVMKTAHVFYVTKILSGKKKNNPTKIKTTGSLLMPEEADEALAFHNKVRSDVGVNALVWSTELSAYAQEWADHLVSNNNCQLQHRSNTGMNSQNYGENLAINYYSSHSAREASEAWYEEISLFSNVVLNKDNWYDAGHYSQMVWRNTTQLGMGSAKCPNGSYVVVANYNPSGNFMGKKAY